MTALNHDNICNDFRETATCMGHVIFSGASTIKIRTSLHFNEHKAAHFVLLSLFCEHRADELVTLESKCLGHNFCSNFCIGRFRDTNSALARYILALCLSF